MTNEYSETELAAIRRAIAPPPPPAPVDVLGLEDWPQYVKPFWKLADLERDLFRRLAEDPWVEALSLYAFFPPTLAQRVDGGPIPAVEYTGRTRGQVAIVRLERATVVIKPYQSAREGEVAAIAGDLGVGPRQLPSLPGYLTEEFAEGDFFTSLPPERRGAAEMEGVGRSLGAMFRRLHDAGIYYNDASLSDPEGRSHLIVDRDGGCLLIDFGVSLLLDRHPEYTREEVHNFVRTLPMYRVFAGMAQDRDEMTGFLNDFRGRMAQATREEIMGRDLQFVQQGLSIAARRMGEGIIAPIRGGFLEGYGQNQDSPD